MHTLPRLLAYLCVPWTPTEAGMPITEQRLPFLLITVSSIRGEADMQVRPRSSTSRSSRKTEDVQHWSSSYLPTVPSIWPRMLWPRLFAPVLFKTIDAGR